MDLNKSVLTSRRIFLKSLARREAFWELHGIAYVRCTLSRQWKAHLRWSSETTIVIFFFLKHKIPLDPTLISSTKVSSRNMNATCKYRRTYLTCIYILLQNTHYLTCFPNQFTRTKKPPVLSYLRLE